MNPKETVHRQGSWAILAIQLKNQIRQIRQVEDMLPVLNVEFLIPCLTLCGFQLSSP